MDGSIPVKGPNSRSVTSGASKARARYSAVALGEGCGCAGGWVNTTDFSGKCASALSMGRGRIESGLKLRGRTT